MYIKTILRECILHLSAAVRSRSSHPTMSAGLTADSASALPHRRHMATFVPKLLQDVSTLYCALSLPF